jgi:hypothetical protein
MKKFIVSLAFLAISTFSFGQAVSSNGGSIQGTITDPTGAAIPGATVVIADPANGYTHTLTTDKAGFYSIGPLVPGSYTISVKAPSFEALTVKTVVRTGTATSGNEKLTLGNTTDTVTVDAGAVQLNTEQPGVTGVITTQQIDTLPVDGRNILDFAQLQPGVQLQPGGSGDGGFDPTKAGYSALSFNGISGRTTRILLDGQDITDETVGTTIFNVSQGSVGEIQVGRANNDASSEIGSSGSVLASTRSGTNGIRGQLFYDFQDQRVGAATFAGDSDPFQRNQFGGSIGGPIIKDKLFFFGNSERLKQDQSAPIELGPEDLAIKIAYPSVASPDRDTYSTIRLDYNGPKSTHFFVRGNYEANSFATGSGYSTYSNRDNTPGVAGGADFVSHNFTHSIRGSYEKFHNLIVDTTLGNTSIYNPIPGYGLADGQGLNFGPNPNAPQQTYQTDKQLRYDGSWTKGAHNLRYGASVNRILGGGLAAFFGYGPQANTSSSTAFTGPIAAAPGIAADPNAPGCKGVPGAAPCPDDPLNGYFPAYIYISNDLGYASEKPGFGLPGGYQGDWRTGVYITDSWKVRPSFTVTMAARWDRDTGRTNSDLPAIPCSEIVAANFNFTGGTPPCTGNSPLFDQWVPGLGGRVAQPNKNVGPQLGFTYNPDHAQKTVLRGGIGIFFESNVFNNVQFDRASRLQTGEFASYPTICGGNDTYPIPGQGNATMTSTGVSISTICSESIAEGAPAVLQLQADARTAGAVASINPQFAGYGLAIQNGDIAYTSNYRSPYSTNVTFGIQQEFARGIVFSADYVHTATVRISQTTDANHVGDSRYFSLSAAQAAVAATTASVGCAGGYSSAAIDCALAAGATLANGFGPNGLDSGKSVDGGSPGTIKNGVQAAFPGVNPNVGVGTFSAPQGKAGYDGLQLNLREQRSHPVPGIIDTNLEVSYAYSRLVTTTGVNGTGSTSDSFFSPPSYNNRLPGTVLGYGNLDRRNIFSAGGSATIKYGIRVGLITHIESAPPTNLTLDTTGGTPGEIFRTDVDGDGQTGDLVPGTEPGAYMRGIKPGSLVKLINNYNATQAGTLTPAGQTLVASGLFTQAQLVAAGGVKPSLALPPTAPFANDMLRTLDANVAYPIRLTRFREGLSIEPSVAMYNVANFANYGGPTGVLLTPLDLNNSGDLGTGYVNGAGGFAAENPTRVTRKTGSFDQGAPRATEFQLKVNF